MKLTSLFFIFLLMACGNGKIPTPNGDKTQQSSGASQDSVNPTPQFPASQIRHYFTQGISFNENNEFSIQIPLQDFIEDITEFQFITSTESSVISENSFQILELKIKDEFILNNIDRNTTSTSFSDVMTVYTQDANGELLTHLINISGEIINPEDLSTTTPPALIDSDGDGILDFHDHCPDTFGSPIYQGCPSTGQSGTIINMCGQGYGNGDIKHEKRFSTARAESCEAHSKIFALKCQLNTNKDKLILISTDALISNYPFYRCVSGNVGSDENENGSGESDNSGEEELTEKECQDRATEAYQNGEYPTYEDYLEDFNKCSESSDNEGDDQGEEADEQLQELCSDFATSQNSQLHKASIYKGRKLTGFIEKNKPMCSLSACFGKGLSNPDRKTKIGSDEYDLKRMSFRGKTIYQACFTGNSKYFDTVVNLEYVKNIATDKTSLNSSVSGKFLPQLGLNTDSTVKNISLSGVESTTLGWNGSKSFDFSIEQSSLEENVFYHSKFVMDIIDNGVKVQRVQVNVRFKIDNQESIEHILANQITPHKIEVFKWIAPFKKHKVDNVLNYRFSLHNLFQTKSNRYIIEEINCIGKYKNKTFDVIEKIHSSSRRSDSFSFISANINHFGSGDPEVYFQCHGVFRNKQSGKVLSTTTDNPLRIKFD